MDERDDSAILDSLGEYLHHFRVVYRVKELFEVHIHDPSVSLVSRVQHVIDRVVRFLVRPETMASGGESRVVVEAEYLCNGLLNQPVLHGGDAQFSELAGFLLWNFGTQDWRGSVCPGPDRFRELVRVTTNVLAEFIRAHSVYSRGAIVSLDPVKGLAEVPALEY